MQFRTAGKHTAYWSYRIVDSRKCWYEGSHRARWYDPAALFPGFGNARFPHRIIQRTAQRIDDDPAILLRNYSKRKRSQKADERLSETIAGFATGFLNK